jgi:hypothetical protein
MSARAWLAPFDPLEEAPRAVSQRAWGWLLAVVMIATALGGATLASRVDPSAPVRAKLEKAGELAKVTDRELSEQIEQARRVGIVGGVAKGLLGVPLLALVAAAATWLLVRLVGARADFGAALTAVALALAPLGVEQTITLVSALRQPSLSEKTAASLVPSSLSRVVKAPAAGSGWKPVAVERLLGLVDFFHLWRALLFGVGLSALTGARRVWAIPGGALLYVLVVAATTVGVPGLLESGGRP